jgi:methyl-accepting chemotaxis protein
MAKQPQLTVNVNSQQFQQFAKQFGQLSGQIKQLNSQFQHINTTLNKANIATRAIHASMNMALSAAKSLGSVVGRITKQFLSWGAIIGGVTALLGMGGGLFGIERLAASIMQKRRQVMGLGGDYGRIQASSIFNQSLMGAPGSVMSNIALGMHGAPDQMKTLMMAGVNPFGKDAASSPDVIMDKLVEKLPELLNKAGPGKQLLMAQAYGLDKIFQDPMDLLRLSTKEGQEEYQERKKLIEQYKDQMKISKPAQKAWTELELQLQAAGAQIKSALGEKLADLAGPLKHLSEGFTQMIRTLMQSPALQAIIKKLAGWIDDLAKKMKDLTEKDINNFIEKIKSWLPTMEQLKSALADFISILKGFSTVFGWLRRFGGGPSIGGAASAAGSGAVHDWLDKHLTEKGKELLHFDSGRKGPAATPQTTPAPSTSAPTSAPTTAPAPSFGAGASPFKDFGGWGGGLGGADPNKMLQLPSAKTGWQNSIGAPGLGAGSTPSWPSAAQKMTPQQSINDRFGNWKGSSDTPQKGGSRPGPLSENNWQMNRVANLVVRNVPGSNLFMSAAGMVG